MGKILVGTSGWQYQHWNKKFYPETIKGTDQLPYYTTHFETVEINGTFYHQPSEATVQGWYDRTPDNYRFSVKMHKYLTHMKLLKMDEAAEERLRSFLTSLLPLADKLSVILIQCPPRMSKNLEKLDTFLDKMAEIMDELKYNKKVTRVAIEFRHETWFSDPNTFKTLQFYGVANVPSDGADKWPISFEVTTDFGYIRLHGNRKLYASLYTINELEQWKAYINLVMKDCKEVFVYFDNDGSAHAVQNAQQMKKLFTN